MAATIVQFFNEGMGIARVGSVTHQVWVHVLASSGRWGVRQRMNVQITPITIAASDLKGDRCANLIASMRRAMCFRFGSPARPASSDASMTS